VSLQPTVTGLATAPSTATVLQRAVLSNLQSPLKMASTLLRFSPAIWSSLGPDGGRSSRVPETRFNHPVSPHKVFDATIFRLDDLKQIKSKAEGATINDVVLAITAGALRRYLQHHEELPPERLLCISPVNARTSDRQAEIPGNNISAMSVPLPTDVEDPLERLRIVRDTTSQTKAAKSGISARLMTDLSRHAPAATLAGVARLVAGGRFTAKLCNLFVSNVPGPQQTLYMNGAKMIHSFGLAPLADGMGLFVATPSYNGEMSFNIISDREMLPDIEFLRECLETAFADLIEAEPGSP
jgi:WS/DGAT/MGAT family acyltransferase